MSGSGTGHDCCHPEFGDGSAIELPRAPTTSLSNGNSSGIVWALQESDYQKNTGQAVLLAYDATNLANLLYRSAQNPDRDKPGLAVKFGVPTIVNGKVHASKNQLSVFGLLPNLPLVFKSWRPVCFSRGLSPKIVAKELPTRTKMRG